MKILLISSLYAPYKRGGAEVVAQKTVDQLLVAGHEVIVVSSGYVNAVDEIGGVKVHRIAPYNIFSFIDINEKPLWQRVIWHVLDQWNVSTARCVKKIVNNERPDLVIAHGLKGLGYLLPFFLRDQKVPVLFTIHDVQLVVPSGLIYLNQENSFFVDNVFNWTLAFYNKILFSFANYIVTPSKWLMGYYTSKGFFTKSKQLVIRNPIEIKSDFIAKEFNYKYCYIGQVEKHKGIILLLEAFEKFVANHPGAELLIIGGGSILEELKVKYNQSWVKFLGYVNYDTLPQEVFSKISYSILASIVYENSPGTVYDGYANSTPVIVPRSGGAPEMVKEGMGYIFEAGKVESLYQALETSVNDKDKYQEMAKKGYEYIKNYKFENYLDSLLNQKSSLD